MYIPLNHFKLCISGMNLEFQTWNCFRIGSMRFLGDFGQRLQSMRRNCRDLDGRLVKGDPSTGQSALRTIHIEVMDKGRFNPRTIGQAKQLGLLAPWLQGKGGNSQNEIENMARSNCLASFFARQRHVSNRWQLIPTQHWNSTTTCCNQFERLKGTHIFKINFMRLALARIVKHA